MIAKMILTSKNNPLIKETASLKEKKGRKTLGAFLVEGKKMSRECIASDFGIERVFLSESFDEKDASWLLPLADKTTFVSDDAFKALSDEKTPQGILCRVKIPETELRPPQGKCLLLDGVADPGNMGAIIRTANAAGYDEIYLTSECTDPYAPKSVRASMSGLFFTKLYVASRAEILNVLNGFPVFVADMGGANIFQVNPPKAYAIVIGNEANGVSDECKAAATQTICIPMRETQESLNAAVSAGIAMYVLAKDEFQN